MSKLVLLWVGLHLLAQAQPIGLFSNHSSVGEADGTAEFDPSTGVYKITGKGANIPAGMLIA